MGNISDFIDALNESDGGCMEITVKANEARDNNE